MSSIIEHKGIVRTVTGNNVQVNIIAQSACSACHAKGACNVSDTEEKIINITTNQVFKIGEPVNVLLSQSLGFKALVYGYLIPFILILTTLITIYAFTNNEALAGIISISILVPYYLIMYIIKDQFNKIFTFKISKL